MKTHRRARTAAEEFELNLVSSSWKAAAALCTSSSQPQYGKNPSRMEAENALRANIKLKGENSYYYAHQPRPTAEPIDAKVLEGEGIITGGDPRLVHVREPAPHAPVLVPIRNYSWADETEKVLVIINFNLPEGATLTAEMVDCRFEPKKVTLAVRVNELEEHKLVLKHLAHNIDVEHSRFRVKNTRVTLVLKKEVNSKWFNLVETSKVEEDKDWA